MRSRPVGSGWPPPPAARLHADHDRADRGGHARGTPLVVFVGETPMPPSGTTRASTSARWRRRPVPASSPRTDRALLEDVRELLRRRTRARPVVLSVPMDLQKRRSEAARLSPVGRDDAAIERMRPIQQMMRRKAVRTRRARSSSPARERCALARRRLEELGEQPVPCWRPRSAPRAFSTTTRARSASPAPSPAIWRANISPHADLVIAVGASLNDYTTDSGYMFPTPRSSRSTSHPRGL